MVEISRVDLAVCRLLPAPRRASALKTVECSSLKHALLRLKNEDILPMESVWLNRVFNLRHAFVLGAILAISRLSANAKFFLRQF
jgi:hypothetical protein